MLTAKDAHSYGQIHPNGRDESVSQPRGPQKSGPRDFSSREAATQVSPARQCRVAKVEQNRVPEGRHSSCDTVSGALARPSRAKLGSCRWPHQLCIRHAACCFAVLFLFTAFSSADVLKVTVNDA